MNDNEHRQYEQEISELKDQVEGLEDDRRNLISRDKTNHNRIKRYEEANRDQGALIVELRGEAADAVVKFRCANVDIALQMAEVDRLKGELKDKRSEITKLKIEAIKEWELLKRAEGIITSIIPLITTGIIYRGSALIHSAAVKFQKELGERFKKLEGE